MDEALVVVVLVDAEGPLCGDDDDAVDSGDEELKEALGWKTRRGRCEGRWLWSESEGGEAEMKV